MSAANDHDIHVLNGLIEATLDSAEGYIEAARETDNGGLRALFEDRGLERRRIAADLQDMVRRLGGKPDEDGSILAKARRAFLDIKHALVRDQAAVVGWVEDGEDGLRGRFERALDDTTISATTREAIRRAFGSVRQGQEQIQGLKHSFDDQASADRTLFPS